MGSQGREALTLERFLGLCEAAPAGVRHEAVGGRAVMMAAPVDRVLRQASDPATRTYVAAAQAKGDELLDVETPFRVTVVPGDLLAREDGAWAPRATRR